MTANESNPGVLVNAPVKFAGATPGVIVTPAPPAGVPAEGLPQSSFTQVVRRDGSREGAIQAVVDPPLGGGYLNIALYMQGASDPQPQLIERKPVAPADQNNPVYFNVFQSLLQDDGVYVFTYEVERISGNSGPSTESWALYHRDLPGGNISGTGAHPDLHISLPPDLGNPPQIGKDEVDRGVAVTLSYPNMRAYDEINLELNRVRFTFTVQPGEESKPFVITVTRSMFERAGSYPEFAFSYTVKDQVNNTTHNRRWSIVIKADVDTERVTLEKAILREILNDNTDNPNTVELPKLNGGPLWALIHLIGRIWNAGDEIHLTFTSMLNGSQVAIHEATLPITQVPGQLSWDIPNDKVIADSIVRVSYKQIRLGKVIGTSKPAEATVIGELVRDVQIIKAIPVGVNPSNIVVNKSGSQVYVSNHGSGTVSVINAGTLEVVGTIQTPTPSGLTVSPGGERLYVCSTSSDKLSIFDARSLAEINSIAAGEFPYYVALSNDGARAYVCSTSGNGNVNSRVWVIDTKMMTVIASILVGQLPYFLALSPNVNHIYVCNLGSDTVSVIDTESLSVITNIPVTSPAAVVFSPDGLHAYIGSHNATVSVIETKTLALVRLISVEGVVSGVTVSPNGKCIYVCMANNHLILVIDTSSWAVLQSISSNSPNEVAVTSDGKLLFTCNTNNNTVTVMGYV